MLTSGWIVTRQHKFLNTSICTGLSLSLAMTGVHNGDVLYNYVLQERMAIQPIGI